MTRKRALFLGTSILAIAMLGVPYLLPEPVPPEFGFSVRTEPFPSLPERIRLLIDSTGHHPETGERVLDHGIFEEVLDMIARANGFIVVDFFLWNPWTGLSDSRPRDLAFELAAALIARKLENPDLPILALTDPINRIYGGDEPEFYHHLAAAGIPVVFTDLNQLPDSNRVYAPLARFYGPLISTVLSPTGVLDRRWLANPFDRNLEPISLRQYGRLLFFKANHRKVLITRSEELGIEMLVGSMNPADGSADHSNLALHVSGPVAQAALGSELSVARWSAAPATVLADQPDRPEETINRILKRTRLEWNETLSSHATARVTWLTESKIREAVVEVLDSTGPEDEVDIAMFYLSDRAVIRSIKHAAQRGGRIRLVLDANRDAFGRRKIGIPNRPVAAELMKLAEDHPIEIRWADTRGEQFHPKAMAVSRSNESDDLLLLGSANWTRRNLANLNLEANLLVADPGPALNEYRAWFDRVWRNAGTHQSIDYEISAISGWPLFWKTIVYRLQEALGAGTF